MSPLLKSSLSLSEESIVSPSHLLLRHRQKLVEDLWESVLLSECGREKLDLFQQMRTLSSPEGQAKDLPQSSVPQLIEKLSLEDAIQAARAFALYFQLTNIVEQHYERRGQQVSIRAIYREPTPQSESNNGLNPERNATSLVLGAERLEESWTEARIPYLLLIIKQLRFTGYFPISKKLICHRECSKNC